jgi:hypothetical protein
VGGTKSTSGPRERFAPGVALLAVLVAFTFALPAVARADETVWSCGNYGNNVFRHGAVFGINTPASCPGNPEFGNGLTVATAGNTVAAGQRAFWEADAPPGLIIVGASIPSGQLASNGINDGQQYGGGFYWQGGGAETHDLETSAGFAPLSTRYFGWQVICGANPCQSNYNWISVALVALYVRETSGPSLVAPDGLWQSSGWIRGDVVLHFYGDSPSGLCSLSASLNGQTIPGSSSAQNPSVWHQCAAPPVMQTVHTWQYGQGAMPLTISASDAAGLPVSYTKTVYVDNSQPTVSMSGPTDAPSTAGVQYVAVAAGGSPSGIAGLACSTDGAPAQWYGGANAQVPVNGVGEHSVQCAAANNAVDGAGNHGWSTWRSWSLKIGVPTVSGIGFGRIVNKLRCHRVRERVLVPAHWVKVRRHGKLVRVHKRAHVKIIKVTRCHPRIVLRRITVWTTVHRRGKRIRVKHKKLVRVVLRPHMVEKTKRRVAYGHGATVNGWLGTSAGIALGGQTVYVLTAPDNGLGQFTTAATAITASNGGWTARLPAGPSRLVQAIYNGAPTTEGAVSAPVHLIVPAKIRLISVWPPRVPWGGTVRIVGKLDGGYLPPGGALVRLRIGTGSAYTTYGVKEHVTGSGRFSTTYTFGLGSPSTHEAFWFQVASLPMGSFAFAPGASGRRLVLVGGHPNLPRKPPHRHAHHRRKRHHRS